jgi:hypothetical protein
MATEGQTFEQWLNAAEVPAERLNDEQRALLHGVFRFLKQANSDYASSRIAGYFLLRCDADLKVAQIARLIGVSDRSAFRHRELSSAEVVRQIQNRLSGRPYGKLLPRHAGSIAQFLFTHPKALRDDLLDFIESTWKFRVSKVALWEFLKKYGLDRDSLAEAPPPATDEENAVATIESLEQPTTGALLPMVPDDFFLPAPNMPELSYSGPKCSLGSTSPTTALPMNTVRSSGVS